MWSQCVGRDFREGQWAMTQMPKNPVNTHYYTFLHITAYITICNHGALHTCQNHGKPSVAPTHLRSTSWFEILIQRTYLTANFRRFGDFTILRKSCSEVLLDFHKLIDFWVQYELEHEDWYMAIAHSATHDLPMFWSIWGQARCLTCPHVPS